MKDYKRLTDRVIAEMLRNTEEESWDSDNPEAQCYIRLAELENKIEDGELISTDHSEQSEQEVAYFAKHNAAVRNQAVKEFSDKILSVSKITFCAFTDARIGLSLTEYKQLVKEASGE